MGRVLLLSLDGACREALSLMLPRMPALRKLIEKHGLHGLRSTVPPTTAPAWASIQTGMNPGKHGIIDFLSYSRADGRTSLVNSLAIRGRSMWEAITASGMRVITVNVPLSYPPARDRRRVTVGCMLSPKVSPDMVYPAEIYPVLRRNSYTILPGFIGRGIAVGLERFVDECIRVEESRFAVAEELMEAYDWDVAAVHNQCLDALQHCFYHLLLGGTEEEREELGRFYAAADRLIERLIRRAGRVSMLAVFSDHGFTLAERYINLNLWLKRRGYLKEKNSGLAYRLALLLRRMDVLRLRNLLLSRLFRNSLPFVKLRTELSLSRIDTHRSRAFIPVGATFGCIYLGGGSEAGLRERLKRELEGITDPASGRRVIARVYLREEVYRGEHAPGLPELVAEPAEGYAFGPQLLGEGRFIRAARHGTELSGAHAMQGVLVMNTKLIASEPELLDIAPSVLAALNLQVPEWMEGRVLQAR